MLLISGTLFNPPSGWMTGDVEQQILERLKDDPARHAYDSPEQLRFDILFRKHVVEAARALYQSGASFEVFAGTHANPAYWTVTNAGGLRLGYGVTPAWALEDIYKNGESYGFECATAVIIVFYYAALRTIGRHAFNQLFPNLYLYSWHIDEDLGLTSVRSTYLIPGDVVYFNNPDFDTDSPQWRGENAVLLMDDLFFGHGIGITGAEEIIRVLNELRQPGSQQSAYRTNVVTRADSRQLYQRSQHLRTQGSWLQKYTSPVTQHNETSISHKRYQYYSSQ
ncbi:protein-glutamine gamma-glutamyltransferase [Salibacterium halotolerans]|uniref:Protein-glutamine gamma-glutamyltransferase n=1 Tax=Salibacterium halotolerans TaxID=1884432 RepID=A0A1I5QHJ1_9BACI|nr:protein-glutamine gamma-glutamyltransferase [Salibacterium halotolerans]SFP45510.1 protein-glutamine gamma-glutamyltransferase [Salibacterium halotolerans]